MIENRFDTTIVAEAMEGVLQTGVQEVIQKYHGEYLTQVNPLKETSIRQ